jgi:CheY-like chemotaxis protein
MSRHLAFDVQLAPALHVALAPERLEQILFWLIIRAHRSGVTQLSLAARREGSEIAIDLRGLEGGGALSTSLTRRPTAVRASLGTSATREVIEQVGGKLSLSDRGGLLHVELRLPAAARAPRPALPAAHARSVLIVEDEPLVLDRLAKLIARRGYRVLTAPSLAEARPLLALGPDMLVTDLQLGDGRGDELAIAAYQRHPERPIVICSGFGADDVLLDHLRGARLTFLSKPFTRSELESAIPETELS